MTKTTPVRVERLAKTARLSKKEARELLVSSDGDMGLARFIARTLRYAEESDRLGPEVKSRRAKDPVFGNITWKHQWKGRSAARTLGPKPSLTVESADGAPPDESQREAYRLFLKHERPLSRPLKDANFRYYRKTRKRWAKWETPEFLDEVAPDVASPKEVAAMLSDATVHVPKQPRAGWEVHLRWHCAWDEEHGHEARVRNGQVTRVGPAGG